MVEPGSMGGIWTRVREGWSWPTTPSGGWEVEEGTGSTAHPGVSTTTFMENLLAMLGQSSSL